MSESTANHYNFPIHPYDIQIKSAYNAVTSYVCVTDSLLIDIHCHSCQVTFIVLHYDQGSYSDHHTYKSIHAYKGMYMHKGIYEHKRIFLHIKAYDLT
jgi:hypothetical protein